jgi:hypothetical protein
MDQHIDDSELVYRSVRNDGEESRIEDGKLVIYSSAFKDNNKEPSVDRALLLEHNPEKSRKDSTQGVIALCVLDIRNISGVESSNPAIGHAIDVIYDPLPENKAHAKIVTDPILGGSRSMQDKTFKKLQKALARLATEAGWCLPPPR